MDFIEFIVGVLLFLIVLGLPATVIYLLVKTHSLSTDVGELTRQVRDLSSKNRDLTARVNWAHNEVVELQGRVDGLRKSGVAMPGAVGEPAPAEVASAPVAAPAPEPEAPAAALTATTPEPEAPAVPLPVTTPEPQVEKRPPASVPEGLGGALAGAKLGAESSPAVAVAVPPSKIPETRRAMPPLRIPKKLLAEPAPEEPRFSLELFTGTRLFAWLGGLALFLAICYFVKYSIERDLIPPAMRIGIAYLSCVGLLGGGVWFNRKDAFTVLGQTLCATGIVGLYATTFAARAHYHFAAFEHGYASTALMVLTTVTAFALAVGMRSHVVAILGILGGFLTPVMLSTGELVVWPLFTYCLLLNAGLLTVARRMRWFYLCALGATGTVLIGAGWASRFMAPELMGDLLGYVVATLFIYMILVRQAFREETGPDAAAWPGFAQRSLAAMGLVAMGVTLLLAVNRMAQDHPALSLAFVFAGQAALFVASRFQSRTRISVMLATAGGMLALGGWALGMREENLAWLLGATVLFGSIHFACVRILNHLVGEGRGGHMESLAGLGIFAMGLSAMLVFRDWSQDASLTWLAFLLAGQAALLVAAWFMDDGRVPLALSSICGICAVGAWATVGMAGDRIGWLLGVVLLYGAVHFACVRLMQRRSDAVEVEGLGGLAALGLFAMALSLMLVLRGWAQDRPVLSLAFVFAGELALLVAAWFMRDGRAPVLLSSVCGALAFGAWALGMREENLMAFLVATFVHGLVHSAYVWFLKQRCKDLACDRLGGLASMVCMGLLFIAIFKLPVLGMAFWMALFLVDLLIVGTALFFASVWGLVASVFLTVIALIVWLFKGTFDVGHLPHLLLLCGGFTAFFVAAAFGLQRLASRMDLAAVSGRIGSLASPGLLRQWIPVQAALFPFLLLTLAIFRLKLADPSQVFGFGVLLAVFLLGLARQFRMHLMPAVVLLAVVVMQHIWFGDVRVAGDPPYWLWALVFMGVVQAYPFVARAAHRESSMPWIASGLSLVMHYLMVHKGVKDTWPNDCMGLLPAAFALPPLALLLVELRARDTDSAVRLSRLAWLGGTALFFVTLVFPVQFDRQWLTIAWALEGAALVWLARRVPHAGLVRTGMALLAVAFVRLAMNPEVLRYHEATGTPVFNWYLYTYGLAIAACILAARWLPGSFETWGSLRLRLLPPVFAVVLGFLLMNIEIADAFTEAGTPVLTFRFGGNLARDLTYSVGWGLFAFGLISTGLWRQLRVVRYAGLVLLGVTFAKVFLVDIVKLEDMYRVGAFAIVALIALATAFLYQKAAKRGPDAPGN